jgi:hypothetical protein
MMWLQGGVGDLGVQSLNFQSFGVAPWIQPRFDTSMPALQPEMYQTMAAAALQEMRTVESSKLASQSHLQFQQSQNVSNGPAALIQRQMLQQSNLQHALLQNFQENQASTQAQFLQQHLQHRNQYTGQQLQQHQPQLQQVQQPKQLNEVSAPQQIPNVISALPHLTSVAPSQSPSLQPISSQCQQQAFSEPLGNSIAASDVSSMHSVIGSLSQDGGSHLLNSNGSNPVISPALLSKRAAIDPQLSSGAAHCALPQVEQLRTTQSTVSDLATLLAPFSGREYSTYQGANDPQNNLLFGVNIDSSTFMLQHGIPNLRNIGTENDPLSMPFAASTFTSATGSDIPLNSDMTASSCVDESGFLQSSENVDQVNPSTRTFVKVNC